MRLPAAGIAEHQHVFATVQEIPFQQNRQLPIQIPLQPRAIKGGQRLLPRQLRVLQPPLLLPLLPLVQFHFAQGQQVAIIGPSFISRQRPLRRILFRKGRQMQLSQAFRHLRFEGRLHTVTSGASSNPSYIVSDTGSTWTRQTGGGSCAGIAARTWASVMASPLATKARKTCSTRSSPVWAAS